MQTKRGKGPKSLSPFLFSQRVPYIVKDPGGVSDPLPGESSLVPENYRPDARDDRIPAEPGPLVPPGLGKKVCETKRVVRCRHLGPPLVYELYEQGVCHGYTVGII